MLFNGGILYKLFHHSALCLCKLASHKAVYESLANIFEYAFGQCGFYVLGCFGICMGREGGICFLAVGLFFGCCRTACARGFISTKRIFVRRRTLPASLVALATVLGRGRGCLLGFWEKMEENTYQK